MWALMLTVAGVAFYTSFEAISGYAVRVGTFPRSRGWCAPVLVDAVTVMGGLLVLVQSTAEQPTGYGWALVAGASLVSVALNVAHAPAHLAAQLVAMLAPAALLVSLEALMLVVREQPPSAAPDSPRAPRTGLAAPREGPEPRSGTETARERVRALLGREDLTQPLTGATVAAELGLSKGRAYQLLREERNGDGSRL
jgi:hypothetical protein